MKVRRIYRSSLLLAIGLEDKLIISFLASEYLEKQRRWAETGAVRDLEFEGDTLMKTLSTMCKQDRKNLTKALAGLSFATNLRWNAIDKKTKHVWLPTTRWRCSIFTDAFGKRILFHPNLIFDSHESARYASMMGQDQDEQEKEEKERILQNEISDLLKRNSEALTSYDEILALEDSIDDDEKKEESNEKEFDEDVLDRDMNETSTTDHMPEASETDATEDGSIDEDLNGTGDQWAKVFTWEDSETIVAR